MKMVLKIILLTRAVLVALMTTVTAVLVGYGIILLLDQANQHPWIAGISAASLVGIGSGKLCYHQGMAKAGKAK